MNTFLDQVYQAFDANILFLFFDGGDDPNKTLLLLLMFGERIFYSSSCPFSAMNKHAGSVVEQFSARSNTNSKYLIHGTILAAPYGSVDSFVPLIQESWI